MLLLANSGDEMNNFLKISLISTMFFLSCNSFADYKPNTIKIDQLSGLLETYNDGLSEACFPKNITISGFVDSSNGKKENKKFFSVSSDPHSLGENIKKTIFKSGKLTEKQSTHIRDLIKYSKLAEKNGNGFSKTYLMTFSNKTNLDVSVDLICLKSEKINANASSESVTVK